MKSIPFGFDTIIVFLRRCCLCVWKRTLSLCQPLFYTPTSRPPPAMASRGRPCLNTAVEDRHFAITNKHCNVSYIHTSLRVDTCISFQDGLELELMQATYMYTHYVQCIYVLLAVMYGEFSS